MSKKNQKSCNLGKKNWKKSKNKNKSNSNSKSKKETVMYITAAMNMCTYKRICSTTNEIDSEGLADVINQRQYGS